MENKTIQRKIDKITNALIEVGFNQNEINLQIEKLGKIIQLSVLKRVISDNNAEKEKINEDVTSYIKSKYSDQEFSRIVQEESGKIVEEYFNQVTMNLDEEKRKNFYQSIED